jgi:hypothetical protein
MNTVCHKQLRFESLFGKQVTADFDAGGLLLRELDERYGLIEGAANCLADPRHGSWLIHELRTLVKQRIFSIALGYEVTMMQRLFEAIQRSRAYQAGSQRHLWIWPRRPRSVGLKTM